VREAAALALRHVCVMRNRASALRVTRIANPTLEPEPKVRIAALRTLAAFETAEAASCIYDSATEAKEADPTVREAAKELIRKGLAASMY
jgi:hypothetical protein